MSSETAGAVRSPDSRAVEWVICSQGVSFVMLKVGLF